MPESELFLRNDNPHPVAAEGAGSGGGISQVESPQTERIISDSKDTVKTVFSSHIARRPNHFADRIMAVAVGNTPSLATRTLFSPRQTGVNAALMAALASAQPGA